MAKSPEERLESKVIRELRKRLLRSDTENKRLKKQLRELEQIAYKSSFDDEDEVEPEEPQRRDDRPDFFCPKCHQPCENRFVLRKVEYFRCEKCSAKGRVQ